MVMFSLLNLEFNYVAESEACSLLVDEPDVMLTGAAVIFAIAAMGLALYKRLKPGQWRQLSARQYQVFGNLPG